MTNNLKTAFGNICAEDKLKSDTMGFLQKEIQKRQKTPRHTVFKRYVVVFISLAVVLLSGHLTYNAYFTPVAYVDVDVNPSIELILNRFDRVIGAQAYNEDGVEIIDLLPIKHKSYEGALTVLLGALTEQGYFQNGGLVSVTLQTEEKSRENELLANIQKGIEKYVTGYHNTAAQIDVFSVSSDTRSQSHEQGISPAKYLAIQELIAVDPTASMESCRGHSLSEIKQLTREHGIHHGNDQVSGPSGGYHSDDRGHHGFRG